MRSEKKHAKYSASGAKRWLTCPASIKLAELAPPSPTSKAADDGTDAHYCLEMLLKNGREKEQETVLFLDMCFDKSMVNYAVQAAMQIWDLMPKGAHLLSETEVQLEGVGFGTADAVIIQHFGTLYVIDFKYGVKAIEADTEQLIYYALGIAERWNFNFKEVKLVIIQPRAKHKKGTMRVHTMTMEELEAWKPKFLVGVERCETADTKVDLVEGEHCFFCAAKNLCPLKIEDRNAKAAKVFADAFTADIIHTDALTTSDMNVAFGMSNAAKAFSKWGPPSREVLVDEGIHFPTKSEMRKIKAGLAKMQNGRVILLSTPKKKRKKATKLKSEVWRLKTKKKTGRKKKSWQRKQKQNRK